MKSTVFLDSILFWTLHVVHSQAFGSLLDRLFFFTNDFEELIFSFSFSNVLVE